MKDRKIIKIFLILLVVSLCFYYLFKDNNDYSTEPLPTHGAPLYKIIGHVFARFFDSFSSNNIEIENVKISREAINQKEMELIAEAEKIKCVELDKECLDLTNIDRDIIETKIFNGKNNNLWHLYEQRILEYTASIKPTSEIYDEIPECFKKVAKDGYRVIQNYKKFQGVFIPDYIIGYQRVLFFTNDNKYVCGFQLHTGQVGI